MDPALPDWKKFLQHEEFQPYMDGWGMGRICLYHIYTQSLVGPLYNLKLPHRPDHSNLLVARSQVKSACNHDDLIFTQCIASPCYNHKAVPYNFMDATLIRSQLEMVTEVDTDPRQTIRPCRRKKRRIFFTSY